MMTEKGSTKIVNFMTLMVGGGGGEMKYLWVNIYMSIYGTFFVFFLRGYNAIFYFYLFYDGSVDMQI